VAVDGEGHRNDLAAPAGQQEDVRAPALMHCLSSGISIGSAPKKKAQSEKSPTISFNPVTGILHITDDVINRLFPFEPTDVAGLTSPNDPLLGAILHIDDLVFNPELSNPNARFCLMVVR
jgi:hypothetical protein